MNGDMMWNEFGMGGMWGFWLFGLLLLVGVTLLVVLAVRSWGGRIGSRPSSDASASPRTGDGSQGRSRPEDVLRERYARGEISTQEYRERLQTMGEHG